MSDHDWQLAQGTVDFRNEERRAGWGRGREVDRSRLSEVASEVEALAAAPPPVICPNCLTDLDDSGYCDGCSYLATIKRPA